MMKIQMTVRGSVIVQVREALAGLRITEMASWDVRVFGGEKGRTTSYRGAEYTEEFARKVAVEVVVTDEQVDRVLNAIMRTLRASGASDGQIQVIPVARNIRLGSGEEEEPEHREAASADRRVA
jgi:nitrogen regulatory protein P-II 1